MTVSSGKSRATAPSAKEQTTKTKIRTTFITGERDRFPGIGQATRRTLLRWPEAARQAGLQIVGFFEVQMALLAILKGLKTVQPLAAEDNLRPIQVTHWKVRMVAPNGTPLR
jgi:hypothetical protein